MPVISVESTQQFPRIPLLLMCGGNLCPYTSWGLIPATSMMGGLLLILPKSLTSARSVLGSEIILTECWNDSYLGKWAVYFLQGWLAGWLANWLAEPWDRTEPLASVAQGPASLLFRHWPWSVSWANFSDVRPHLILPKSVNAVTSLMSFLGTLLPNYKYHTPTRIRHPEY